MNLFNEYENRMLNYLISYITKVSCCISDPLSPKQLKSELGESDKSNEQLTSPELIDMIIGSNAPNSLGLNMFLNNNDGILPILYWETTNPTRFTKAERSWLYYFLSDKKSDLFIKPIIKQNLLLALSKDEIIDLNNVFDERRKTNSLEISEKYIHNFKFITFAIRQAKIIEIEIKNNDNTKRNYKVLPYMIHYDDVFDEFYLIAITYAPTLSDIHLINLSDITYIDNATYSTILENVERNFRLEAENVIKNHFVSEPISIEIFNNGKTLSSNKGNMADDRSAYLFAQYETVNFINASGHIQMNIYYYDFQYEEIFSKLLSMGKHIKILGPNTVVNDLLSFI